MREDEMVGWHHQLKDMSLSKLRSWEAWITAIHGPWGCKEWDMTEQLNRTEYHYYICYNFINLAI